MHIFSYKDRPVHLGPYPLERLTRQPRRPDLGRLAPRADTLLLCCSRAAEPGGEIVVDI